MVAVNSHCPRRLSKHFECPVRIWSASIEDEALGNRFQDAMITLAGFWCYRGESVKLVRLAFRRIV